MYAIGYQIVIYEETGEVDTRLQSAWSWTVAHFSAGRILVGFMSSLKITKNIQLWPNGILEKKKYDSDDGLNNNNIRKCTSW